MSNEGNKANKNKGKDSGDTPSSSPPQAPHYFGNLIRRTLLSNQGASLFLRTFDNSYNPSMMKPALTPDMIPFTSISSNSLAQSRAGNNVEEEGYDAIDDVSSNTPNASYSKLKADRLKNGSKALDPQDDTAGGLSDQYKDENNQKHNSDEMPSDKKTVDKSTAGRTKTSVARGRNTNVTSSKSSVGDWRRPGEDNNSSSPSSSLEISKVRQSERSAHMELSPAKLRQASKTDKNERPIDVTIHIGRIEVKAIQQVESQRSTHSFAATNQIASSAGPKYTAPHMTLNDYLRKRAEGKY